MAFLAKYFGRDALAFLLVGGGGALGYVVLSTFMLGQNLGPDWVVSGFCYGAMVLPVYLAHRAFSFRSDAPHQQAFPRYVGTQIMAVALATLLSFLVFDMLSFQALPGSVIVVGATSAFSYFVLRMWTFATKQT